jgi:polysaccharide pyruvyl transferase CsaB
MDASQAGARPELIRRVGISGSYGGLNLGDEAILDSIITQLRQSMPVEITVFSRDPADTLARHAVDRAVPVRELSRNEVLPEVARLDLLILGGGGILFDAEANLYLREVTLAQEHGIPVLVYAVSAGPLKDAQARQAVRDALNAADVITVRDRQARKLLEEAGVTRDIHVTVDPALFLEPESLPADALRREGIDPERRLIGMSVREPGPAAPDLDPAHYHGLLANIADYVVERFDADVVFVPMERKMLDVQHAHAVVAQMAAAQRATVLKGTYSSREMLGLIGHIEFAIGMRLHFLIFAALQRVPFVALPYAGKVSGFLEDLQIAMPPVQEVNPGRVLAYIDRSWDLRRDIRAHIEASLPALQARARETNEFAVRLLTTRPRVMAVEVPQVIA